MSKILPLLTSIRLAWKIERGKHSSLLCLNIITEEEKLGNCDIRSYMNYSVLNETIQNK
jgi:hypothetical protein